MIKEFIKALKRSRRIFSDYLDKNEEPSGCGVDSRTVPDVIVSAGLALGMIDDSLKLYKEHCDCDGVECRWCNRDYSYWYPGEKLPEFTPRKQQILVDGGEWYSTQCIIDAWNSESPKPSIRRWIKGGDQPWDASEEVPDIIHHSEMDIKDMWPAGRIVTIRVEMRTDKSISDLARSLRRHVPYNGEDGVNVVGIDFEDHFGENERVSGIIEEGAQKMVDLTNEIQQKIMMEKLKDDD